MIDRLKILSQLKSHLFHNIVKVTLSFAGDTVQHVTCGCSLGDSFSDSRRGFPRAHAFLSYSAGT